MRAFLRFLAFVLVVAAVVAALRYTVFAPEPEPVTVFRVARGLVEETVTNSKAGTITSRRRAGLSPQIGGRVSEIPAREGERAPRVVLRGRALEVAEARGIKTVMVSLTHAEGMAAAVAVAVL